jgi:hypothetical protein
MTQTLQHQSTRDDARGERRWARGLAAAALGAALSACSSTSFVATWKAPGQAPIDPNGSRVAAVVMVKNESARRAAEDRLAAEISSHGAQGVPMYRMMPEALGTGDEAKAREVLERENIKGVVVLRPINIQKEWVVTPSTYGDPYYSGYWGGYYGYGWDHPWGGGADVRVDEVVSVETLLYSLPQNKLLWGGQSKTTNPQDVDELVSEVATAAAKELQYDGVIAKN